MRLRLIGASLAAATAFGLLATAADLKANPDVAQFQGVAGTAQPYQLGTQYTNIETNTWEPAIEKILQGAPASSTLAGANSQINGYLGG